MPEICGHSHGSYQDRLEYCTLEAAQPHESAEVVTDLLDALLYEKDDLSDESHGWSGTAERHAQSRKFSYFSTEADSPNWSPVETEIAIRHTVNERLQHNRYEVLLGWRIEAAEDRHAAYATGYTIDIFEQGIVHAYLEEPDLYSGESCTRWMTNYDYDQLFTELQRVYSMLPSRDQRDEL